MQDILPNFEVLDFIGRGGMGAVYKARQRSLNRVVAIKLISVNSPGSPMDFAARFKVEAQAMARLSHSNIVPVHDFGETSDGHLYYVMELVEGTDLAKHIEANGNLRPEAAVRIVLAVCDALVCAHAQGVVHRDIKPSNILINRDGHVKVADFGLAKIDDPGSATLTLSGTSMGSQGYAAPEVFENTGKVDHRADIYSLGVLLYEMLTGNVPRGLFKMASEKVLGLDPRLDEVICKAMEEDREERYQTVAEMRVELEEIRSAAQIVFLSSGDEGVVKSITTKPLRRWRHLAWMAAVVVFSGIVLAMIRPGQTMSSRLFPVPPSSGTAPVTASAAGGVTQEELHKLGAWLLSLPLSPEPAHAFFQVPDVDHKRRMLSNMPAAPVSIRTGPLHVDEKAREHLAILGRVSSLTNLRIYEVDDAAALSCVRDLTKLGILTFNATPPGPLPMPDKNLEHLSRLKLLNSLRLTGWSELTGQGLANLNQKRKLTMLALSDCPDLSDEGLAEVARFTKLQRLELTCGAKVTDAGIVKLAALRELEDLRLKGEDGTKISEAGIEALAGLTKLTKLQLTGAFPRGGIGLASKFKSLNELHLSGSTAITDADLDVLTQLDKLILLRLDKTPITGTGFTALRGFTNPLHLDVGSCRIGDAGIRAIVQGIPTLEALTLSHYRPDLSVKTMVEVLRSLKGFRRLFLTYQFNNADMPMIATLTSLHTLGLAGSDVTDAGVKHLQSMVKLNELDLTGVKITNLSVPVLKKLCGLKLLNLTGTWINDNGVSAIQSALPECVVKGR